MKSERKYTLFLVLFLRFQLRVEGASPVILSPVNLATISVDENDETSTPVAITLEGKNIIKY